MKSSVCATKTAEISVILKLELSPGFARITECVFWTTSDFRLKTVLAQLAYVVSKRKKKRKKKCLQVSTLISLASKVFPCTISPSSLPASGTRYAFQSSLSRPTSTVTTCYLFCLLHDLPNTLSDRLYDKVPNVIILHIFLKARDQEWSILM